MATYDLPKTQSPGYTEEDFPPFSGLNLSSAVDQVGPGEAIDALNVDFVEPGIVKSRDGYTGFVTTSTEAATLGPYYNQDGTTLQLIVGQLANYDAVSPAAGITSHAVTAGLKPGIVNFSAPGTSLCYVCNGKVFSQWDGTSWGNPTSTVDGVGGLASPKPLSMAMMPTSNRLVAGRFIGTADGPNGAATNPSTVYFSNPGQPTSWNITPAPAGPGNNSIQFHPGDGETITDIVAWREFVFIFKQTKFAVVYGESTAGDGSPIFNYKVVDLGVGSSTARAAPDGVYFADVSGVYRTTGPLAPTKVSGPVDPIFFSDRASPFYTGGSAAAGTRLNLSMAVYEGRIYLAFASSLLNNRVLVYDPPQDNWTLYDWAASCMASWSPTGIAERPKLYIGIANSGGVVKVHSPASTTDSGVAIAAKWQGGFNDFGSSDEKVIRESKLWGTGTITYSIAPDFQPQTSPLTRSETVAFTAPIQSQSYVGSRSRLAVRGTTLSTRISGSGQWSVRRGTHHLRDQRISSVVEA